MIALIDYGAGNLTSVRKALTASGAEFVSPRTPADLARVDGIVVPGVGHFGATASLHGPWRDAIRTRVANGCPLFGICLGMQWLFEESTEAPGIAGLGLLRGRCTRLDDRNQTLKVPHVGWNTLELPRPTRLLAHVAQGTYVYFTHSYAAPVTGDAAATTSYGNVFAAAVEHEHVFGVQFHPEKSSDAGLRMIRNFLARCRQQPVARTS